MKKYAIVYDIGWTVFRCEPDGKRYEIARLNTFEEAMSAARYDNGGPLVIKADSLVYGE